jgi:hypothetical protein
MYGFIDNTGCNAALSAGYIVKKAGTQSPYNRKMEEIISAIHKHCPNMDSNEYIMLDRFGSTMSVVRLFAHDEDARRYAKSSKQKHYMDISTWSYRPASLRQAIWDLITQ